MARVVDGLHTCGLIDASGWLSVVGRKTRSRSSRSPTTSLTCSRASCSSTSCRRCGAGRALPLGRWIAVQIGLREQADGCAGVT